MSSVIVWFLPRENETQWDVEIGKPWPYNKLMAPFEFPIYKSDVQIQHERDSLMKTYQPYFELKAGVESEEVHKLLDDWNHSGLSANFATRMLRDRLVQRLRELYRAGIVANDDMTTLEKDGIKSIRIYQGITNVRQRSITELNTQLTAYKRLRQVLEVSLDSMHIDNALLGGFNPNNYLQANLIYDERKSKAALDALEDAVATSSGMVYTGEVIIDRGYRVDSITYQKISSYQQVQKSRSRSSSENNLILVGQALFVLVVLICFAVYFGLFRIDYISSLRSLLLVIILTLTFPIVTSILMLNPIVSVYVIPYAMLPILVRIFMDSRTAFMSHITAVLLSAIALHYKFEFVTVQMIAGLVAIYSLRELSERSQMIRSAVWVTATSLVVMLSLELMQGHAPVAMEGMTLMDYTFFNHILMSGVLLLFTYPLLFVLERIFGFTSNVTLVELSNINNSLLRNLSEVAPGTFQHSMQVSNLAAEVARKIGANSQLVRTGALYHDIGKTYNPPFFTENQTGYNPHSQLNFEDSAKVIIRHVTEGLQMADKAKLPKVIRDFISTHHGRGLVKYFYISYKNKYPDMPVDESVFTYPGPNPTTSEQAILMMADAVEASSRSLQEYTEESISQLVDKIIEGQLAEGYFRECPITFRDIQIAKDVFKDKLKTIYHTRISYPTLNKSSQ